jgi:hypothetical protein
MVSLIFRVVAGAMTAFGNYATNLFDTASDTINSAL